MNRQTISLTTAVLMIINIMVGSGILIGPGLMAGVAGNASFLCWPLLALIFLPLVLSVVQLSILFPKAGGFYLYAKEGLNVQAGIISGVLYLCGYTCSAAIEVLALKQIALNACGIESSYAASLGFNLLLVGVCVMLNLLSIRILSGLLNSLTLSKLLPLFIIVIMIPWILNPTFTITGSELSLLPFSLPMAIFGYFGFEYASSISHLIKDSAKNAPRALMIGFLGTAVIYTLFHFGLLNLMGAEGLAKCGAAEFAQFINAPSTFLKYFLMLLVPLASAITLFAAANGMINGNALLMHAMAESGDLRGTKWLTPLNAAQRPWIAVLVQGVIILTIVTIVPHISIVANLCNMSLLASFLLPFVALLMVQRRMRKNCFAQGLTLIALFIALALTVYSFYGVGTTLFERCAYALALVALVLAGLSLINRKK